MIKRKINILEAKTAVLNKAEVKARLAKEDVADNTFVIDTEKGLVYLCNGTTEMNLVASAARLNSQLTAGKTVGYVDEGKVFPKGTSVESILREILEGGGTPVVQETVTLGKSSLSFAATSAGAQSVSVTCSMSSTQWTVSANQDWIQFEPTGGQGSGSFTVNVSANENTTQRTGIITVSYAGKSATVSVTQAAKAVVTRTLGYTNIQNPTVSVRQINGENVLVVSGSTASGNAENPIQYENSDIPVGFNITGKDSSIVFRIDGATFGNPNNSAHPTEAIYTYNNGLGLENYYKPSRLGTVNYTVNGDTITINSQIFADGTDYKLIYTK